MALWMAWWDAIWLLRPAFSRLRSFMWFATVVAGFTVRTELLGVTSILRAIKLRPVLYNKPRDSLHSSAVQLDQLSALWTQAVLRLTSCSNYSFEWLVMMKSSADHTMCIFKPVRFAAGNFSLSIIQRHVGHYR
jgi:hypothetical protein